jgi:hypothetical protein
LTKKKYISKKRKLDGVSETNAEYSKDGKLLSMLFKGLAISSLSEQEDEMRRYSQSLTPIERLAYLYQLNLIAFGEELRLPAKELWNKKITIDKP